MIKYKFLQQVHKIQLINWDWFGIFYSFQNKLPPKTCSYHNILPWNCLSYFSFNWFLLFSLSFQETLSWCLLPLKYQMILFPKKTYHGRTNTLGASLWRVLYIGRLIKSWQEGEFHKCIFLYLKTVNLNIFPKHSGTSTWL